MFYTYMHFLPYNMQLTHNIQTTINKPVVTWHDMTKYSIWSDMVTKQQTLL